MFHDLHKAFSRLFAIRGWSDFEKETLPKVRLPLQQTRRVMNATENITDAEKQKTVQQLICSASLNTGIHGQSEQLTFISVLNSFLSITAFLGNVLILIAIRKETSLRPSSKLLLRSLATTDLCVGLFSQPLYASLLVIIVNEHWNICHRVLLGVSATSFILCAVSLMTLTAISVDRLLALLLGLRYRHVVTLTRTNIIIVTFWVVSIALPLMSLWNPLISSWGMIINYALCVTISIFSYTIIFIYLRRHQNQVNTQAQQSNQTNQLNMARYRKVLAASLWLQFALVACYLPDGLVFAMVSSSKPTAAVFLAWDYTTTLVFLNSSLNPILYCWKIVGVRQAVKATIRQVLCCS